MSVPTRLGGLALSGAGERCWGAGSVLETTRKPPSREVEVAQHPISLQTGLDEGLSAPRDPR